MIGDWSGVHAGWGAAFLGVKRGFVCENLFLERNDWQAMMCTV